MKTYNLCLLGFGNVGRALARLLAAKAAEMREGFGIEWRITGVASRRLGWAVAPAGFDVERLLAGEVASEVSPAPTDVRAWLAASRADVMFETTSLEPLTGQPAIDFIRAALEAGAHAVTANKGTVAHGYAELSQLARARGRHFMFEATVADCLPVFSTFRESLPATQLLEFRALLNSTTTVILEEIERGRTFDEGVERAQLMGITETDPAYDVEGWDAAVKVCALANVLMGEPLALEEIERVGIHQLDAMHVRAAREEGRPFRLISRAWRDGGRLRASVRPEQLEPDDLFASLGGSSLAITFALDVLPGLTVAAHQPNLQSTAYGLLADFINIVRGEDREGR
ncbi:MAG: homoserine dehydrogenase [Acidobacteriota bacterium]|nr:homoserine dehydrogenase [Acidobacteriota bacterium]